MGVVVLESYQIIRKSLHVYQLVNIRKRGGGEGFLRVSGSVLGVTPQNRTSLS